MKTAMNCWAQTFAAAFIVSIVMTHVSIKLAKKLDVYDKPNDIKIHETPIPRLGGIGIICGIAAAIISIRLCEVAVTNAAISAMIIVAMTGLADDYKSVKPLTKIGGQIVGAIIYIIFSYIYQCKVGVWLPIHLIFTMIAIIGLSNSFNLMDGMNGLLAGMSVIVFTTGAIIATTNNMNGISLLFIGTSAACLGFLLFNYPRAKTFMGDSGSLTLGTISALFLIKLVIEHGLLSTPALGWLTVLSVPVSDTILAIVRRISRRESFLKGDRNHIYDNMAQIMNGNTAKTVIVMWIVIITTAGLGILASNQGALINALVIAMFTYINTLAFGIVLDAPIRLRTPSHSEGKYHR
jgi:UDP-GlcNAc:undecaprenyl-phosphate GlcNAc-1-phosphate transferase